MINVLELTDRILNPIGALPFTQEENGQCGIYNIANFLNSDQPFNYKNKAGGHYNEHIEEILNKCITHPKKLYIYPEISIPRVLGPISKGNLKYLFDNTLYEMCVGLHFHLLTVSSRRNNHGYHYVTVYIIDDIIILADPVIGKYCKVTFDNLYEIYNQNIIEVSSLRYSNDENDYMHKFIIYDDDDRFEHLKFIFNLKK